MTEIDAETGHTFHDWSKPHIRVTRSPDARQPFHCALIAGNGERTWWTENYQDRDGARDAVLVLGRLFSPVGRASVYLPMGAPQGGGYLEVWLDNQELGEKYAIPIRYVAEPA